MTEEPPNYQPQPARFGEKCENCKFTGTDKGKSGNYCQKYQQAVRIPIGSETIGSGTEYQSGVSP